MFSRSAQMLEINVVAVPGVAGLIGMCACPGGRRAHAADFDAELDLGRDLQTVREFGARLLVTLMEERELSMLGVHALPIAARRVGLEWKHLPIIDMSVPTAVFEHRWETVGEELRAALSAGEHVVLHCYAGLGRTGTIAAKLLIEFGLQPAQAVAAVRGARVGAIQTRQQEKYVKKLKAGITG
jgi:ADP-ribosyl-[dinitrogen reductase] hydrolase